MNMLIMLEVRLFTLLVRLTGSTIHVVEKLKNNTRFPSWKATQITTILLFFYHTSLQITSTNYKFNIFQNLNVIDTHQICN